MNREEHWQGIYTKKAQEEFSWFQPVPRASLDLIKNLDLPQNASIIDIGGGDSFLVDHLLQLGYTDITVLDISSKAIERAKARLGANQNNVHWIVSDVVNFLPERTYQLWHDRAVFHFLTDPSEQKTYRSMAEQGIANKGHLVMGTFSTKGPKKCSGIEVAQYDESSLTDCFSQGFEKIRCFEDTHLTPSQSEQVFQFCYLKRR